MEYGDGYINMSEDASRYFAVLHQIELDLDIPSDELLALSRSQLDQRIERWFNQRANITGERRRPSEDFKQGVYDWKEVERELENE